MVLNFGYITGRYAAFIGKVTKKKCLHLVKHVQLFSKKNYDADKTKIKNLDRDTI